MRKSNSAQSMKSMELVFSMLLFLVFVLSAVFTILIGSRVYENIRARNDASFYSDTALGYITNKVRQTDSAGSVTVQEVDGVSVLLLYSGTEETPCETWIYTANGQLQELFTLTGSGLGVGDGLSIMECQDVSFSLEETDNGALLNINLSTDSGIKTARLSLRSRQEGGARP